MKEFMYEKSTKISCILLIVLFLIYFLGAFYFKTHFFFKTSVNGIDISFKTVDEAKDIVYNELSDFKVVIKDDSNEDKIESKDINLEYNGDKKIEEIKEKQSFFKWASALIYNKQYENLDIFTYDESMLEEKVKDLNFFKNLDVIEPKNPQFQYTDGKYIVLEEVKGNKLNYEKTVKAIKSAIEHGNKVVDLNTTGCYERPKYTKDSEKVKEVKDIIDKYVYSKIVYSFDELMETVDGSIINKWIDIDDDIGDTYVEVNITRQHLWFYKNGKLLTQGDIVTGCQSKNTPTAEGVYALNYKQKDATLKGDGYSSKVSYWMPFNGNIGLHDARWRSSFGGNIYKTNGTHGCVNMPQYLAKIIFENIESNTPIICYSEDTKNNN
ncbi:MAG: L,D-transpeptidase family protein [Clostridium sp.]|uniref:L,D-transpeptidase family protein n=1 Tax=Clostridium sp. TaxID=1506 RepID=UPI0028FDD963|nr:L,D-transpeptidase family protein [Clostridium sp.]MDU1231134.1 L,D-transpeptidase family protein [Clostridium sp.]